MIDSDTELYNKHRKAIAIKMHLFEMKNGLFSIIFLFQQTHLAALFSIILFYYYYYCFPFECVCYMFKLSMGSATVYLGSVSIFIPPQFLIES